MKYYAYINSLDSGRYELGECATLKKAIVRYIILTTTFSSSQRDAVNIVYICDESNNILCVARRSSNTFNFVSEDTTLNPHC